MNIDVETLDHITAILGAHLHLKLIPGTDWGYDNVLGRIQYPRRRLLEFTRERATGELWRTVQHAISSRGELDPYDVAVDAVIASESRVGSRVMHPRWILQLMHVAERERVESIARTTARNLGNTFLPIRWQGWRAPQEREDRTALREPATTAADYWARATVAFGAIAAGALAARDLPADLAWDGTIIEKIQSLRSAPTYDEMLESVERLVPDLTKTWLESMAPAEKADAADKADDDENDQADGQDPCDEPSPTPEGEDDANGRNDDETSDRGDEQDAGDREDTADQADPGCGDAPGTDDDGTDPPPVTVADDDGESLADVVARVLPEILDAITEEVKAMGADRVTIDFFENDPAANPSTAGHQLPEPSGGWGNAELYDHNGEVLGPAWSAVSRTNARISAPIRRLFNHYLAENDIGEMMRSQPAGRLNRRIAMMPSSRRPPFKRRRETHDRSWAVALVLDRSGSMQAPAPGSAYVEAFGNTPLQRWHLTARMAVGILEALDRIPGASTTVICYDDEIDVTKTLADRLTSTVRQRIMDKVLAHGNNDDAGALSAALAQLRRSAAERKVLLHLTDGQFCSAEAEMTRITCEIRSAGVEWVVLTLGVGPEFARRFVPHHLADEISDDTIGTILAKHLRRMVDQTAA